MGLPDDGEYTHADHHPRLHISLIHGRGTPRVMEPTSGAESLRPSTQKAPERTIESPGRCSSIRTSAPLPRGQPLPRRRLHRGEGSLQRPTAAALAEQRADLGGELHVGHVLLGGRGRA